MNKIILTPFRALENKRIYYLYNEYLKMFNKYDLTLIVIGPNDNNALNSLVDYCDGLLLSGGKDVDPTRYHQPCNLLTNKELDKLEELEFKLIKMFALKNKPILGICRGIQTINVAFGGTLLQDINQTKRFETHQQASIEGYHHLVNPVNNTLLKKYLPDSFLTNSFHHQAIDQVASGFLVNAYSDDLMIEGIERGNIIGIQWHPEKNSDNGQIQIMKLFKDLLEENK